MPGTDDIKLSWLTWSFIFIIFLAAANIIKIILVITTICSTCYLMKYHGIEIPVDIFILWDKISFLSFVIFSGYIVIFAITNAITDLQEKKENTGRDNHD